MEGVPPSAAFSICVAPGVPAGELQSGQILVSTGTGLRAKWMRAAAIAATWQKGVLKFRLKVTGNAFVVVHRDSLFNNTIYLPQLLL
jgi:hypothetical protein